MDGPADEADVATEIQEALIGLAEVDRDVMAFLPGPERRDRIREVSSTAPGGLVWPRRAAAPSDRTAA